MPITAECIFEEDVPVGQSLAADHFLLSSFSRPDGRQSPVLRIFSLAEPCLLLGRYQPLPPGVCCTSTGATLLQRRWTGGRAVPGGPGFLGVSLVLPAPWDLLTDPSRHLPPELVLNRYVRGVLRGLHLIGVPRAAYPGRDVLTVERRRIALVAFTLEESGAVLFECQLALSEDFGLLEERLQGLDEQLLSSGYYLPHPLPTSVVSEKSEGVSSSEAMAAIRRGMEERLGLQFTERSWREEELREIRRVREEIVDQEEWVADRRPGPSLTTEAAAEIQLGLLTVFVSLGDGGKIQSLMMSGDFLSRDSTVRALEENLRGQPSEWRRLGQITDQVLNQPLHFILGLGNRKMIPDTILKAVGRASSPRA